MRRRKKIVTLEENIDHDNNILVLYVFHEYNDRVKYFIENAIFDSEKVDFIMVYNGKYIDFKCPNYVKKIFTRENKGHDFGGWSYALLADSLYENYDNFIFVNSTVKGPYLRKDFEDKWTDIFISGLEKYKLFGSTINSQSNPRHGAHVQSYIFSMNQTTLKYLILVNIFSIKNYARTKDDAIWKKEVLMSRLILNKGWNIGCLLKVYEDCDFTFRTNKKSIPSLNDLMYKEHRNIYWNEYDIIFIKANRIPDI